ncbi:MAG: hypothetical protein AAGF59_09040 [Pseudomonadota bacterium]
MNDMVLWASAALIILAFAGVVWLNRRRMRMDVARTSNSAAEFQSLADELRRTNDILEKTVADHEVRLKRLEDQAPGAS